MTTLSDATWRFTPINFGGDPLQLTNDAGSKFVQGFSVDGKERIRHTALSVPYHEGVGWIGGLLPTVAFSLVVATGNIHCGLWYPAVVVFAGFLIGLLCKWEAHGKDLSEDDA